MTGRIIRKANVKKESNYYKIRLVRSVYLGVQVHKSFDMNGLYTEWHSLVSYTLNHLYVVNTKMNVKGHIDGLAKSSHQ